MGTNYYLHTKPCPCCGVTKPPIHIGKSSGGWVFALHISPNDGINTLDDWRKEWAKPNIEIRDEYDGVILPEEMEKCITDRRWRNQFDNFDWTMGGAYKDEADFHAKNGSERGPNNLLRYKIGMWCKGHGEGTWDYVLGDFS